jgi:hypothetical protein
LQQAVAVDQDLLVVTLLDQTVAQAAHLLITPLLVWLLHTQVAVVLEHLVVPLEQVEAEAQLLVTQTLMQLLIQDLVAEVHLKTVVLVVMVVQD